MEVLLFILFCTLCAFGAWAETRQRRRDEQTRLHEIEETIARALERLHP
jgi:hypothetical protein